MLRRLSSFLADASLTAAQTDTDAEVLNLVAEHARELTDATHATASWTGPGTEVRARSSDAEAPEQQDMLERLESVGDTLPKRVSRAAWQGEPVLRDMPACNVLRVPFTGLDGAPAGSLQLVGKRTGEFSDVDEAVAIHLAEMAAAALERAQLYRASVRT